MDLLSDTAVYGGTFRPGQVGVGQLIRNDGAPLLQALMFPDQYIASLAGRAVACANMHPTPGFHAIKKPSIYSVRTTARENKMLLGAAYDDILSTGCKKAKEVHSQLRDCQNACHDVASVSSQAGTSKFARKKFFTTSYMDCLHAFSIGCGHTCLATELAPFDSRINTSNRGRFSAANAAFHVNGSHSTYFSVAREMSSFGGRNFAQRLDRNQIANRLVAEKSSKSQYVNDQAEEIEEFDDWS